MPPRDHSLALLLSPHHRLPSVHAITPAWLHAAGVAGLLLDLDGTLLDDRATSCPGATVAWARDLRRAGVGLCIVSNSGARRVAPIAAAIAADLPIVCAARKPLPGALRRAARGLRIDAAAGAIAMVGDQVFTDVLAGRLAGLRTILVEPTAPDDRAQPWVTRWKRPIERWWLARRDG